MFKEDNTSKRVKRPDWLKVKAPGGKKYVEIKAMMKNKSLHTVCEEAHCPNIGECWGLGTATFMILGDVCARNCRFCAVNSGKPLTLDPNEPKHVAESIHKMQLKHAVITSVTRDDLSDGGSKIWDETIKEVTHLNPETTIEVLIPDFNGKTDDIQRVIKAKPDILNHNIETVPRLYKTVRPKANYQRSLDLLLYCFEYGLKTKSGIMVGLGETNDEVFEVLEDLLVHKVKIVTIGQYLQPTKQHLPIKRFVKPVEFMEFKKKGKEMGFEVVEAAPLVRSSYHAGNYV
ncbi:lipoyl synthase [Bacteroidota bacterium]